MNDPQDAGVLVRLAYQAMRKLDVDADLVLERCRLKKEDLYDSKLRTPNSEQSRFWHAAEEISGDMNIGLHIGEAAPVYKGQVLEYLFLSSPTFGDGLNRMANYQRLISDVLNTQLHSDETGVYITSSLGPYPVRHFTEALGVGLVKFFQFVTEDQFQPLQIHYRHEAITPIEEYERILQCEVLFGCDENRLYFSPDVLKFRLLHSEPELLKFHQQLADQQVANLQRQDLIVEVNKQIGSLLETGEISLEKVASQMAMSTRSLRGQLNESGTNFNQLLNNYRCRLAKRLLSRTDNSIHEIVYLTGFSEPSTFYRAFKRWESTTPIEYRRRKKSEYQTS